MPVVRMTVRERPNDSVEGKPTHRFGVLINISVVVIVDELVPERLAKDQPRDCREKDADGNDRGLRTMW